MAVVRNRIKIIRDESDLNVGPSVLAIDLGQTLLAVYEKAPQDFIDESCMDAASFFKNIVNDNLASDTKGILFSNIGILQEPDFKLNVPQFLLNFSVNYDVYLYWPYLVLEGCKLAWDASSATRAIYFQPNVLNIMETDNEVL